MRQRFRSFHPSKGVLTLVLLGGFALLLAFPAGIAIAEDVTIAEANGQLGLGAVEPETRFTETPPLAAEGSQEAPWLETSIYLVVASLVFAGYALAARKVPWLRPRRHRKS